MLKIVLHPENRLNKNNNVRHSAFLSQFNSSIFNLGIVKRDLQPTCAHAAIYAATIRATHGARVASTLIVDRIKHVNTALTVIHAVSSVYQKFVSATYAIEDIGSVVIIN